MSAKPMPDRTAGKSDRTRGRDESTERTEAAPLNLGCGTLLVLFLLVATAGKFLPHGDKAVKTAAKPVVTKSHEPKNGHETHSLPSVTEQRTSTAKMTVSPDQKTPQPKPVASHARENPKIGFDSLLSQLGDWVGRSERGGPQPAPAYPSAPAIKSDKLPRAAIKTSPASQPAVPSHVVSGPVPNAAVKPEIHRTASSKLLVDPVSSPPPSPASSVLSGPVARMPDAVLAGKSVVFNSPWNQSVEQVERYLKRHTHNADSIEVLEWGKVARVDQGYQVRCTFKSRNVLGNVATQSKVFVLDKNGEVSDIRD